MIVVILTWVGGSLSIPWNRQGASLPIEYLESTGSSPSIGTRRVASIDRVSSAASSSCSNCVASVVGRAKQLAAFVAALYY